MSLRLLRPSHHSLCLAICLLGACAGPRASAPQQSSAVSARTLPSTTVFESSTALMPRAVTSFGAAAFEGAVYAFGGYHGTPHAYSREGQSGELWKLAPGAREFSLVATSEPTQGAALVSVASGLVRLGGMRARNASGEPDDIVSLAEVALFSPASNAWTALPPLPNARSSHAAAVLGDTIYIAGGWQLQGTAQSGRFADSLLAFDVASQSYRTLPQPFRLRAIALAPLDGKLVAMGGITQDGKTSREVHVFDPASATWSRGAELPTDGFGMSAVSNGDVLYASARDGALYELATPTGSWHAVARLTFPRFFHQLVMTSPMQVVALGGISGMHAGPRIRPVESLDVAQPGPRVLSFVISNPLPARNRQGAFVAGDSLYVFGGNRSLAQHDFGPDDFVNRAARLDLASLGWVDLPDLPVARQTMQTLSDDSGAFALGGFGHDGTQARAHADGFRFDLESERWQPDPSTLPTPRTQFGLVSAAGKRWVFGGLDFKPEQQGEAQFSHPTELLSAAPGEPFKPSGVQLPRARRAFGGAELEGRYYLIGGMAGGFDAVSVCDVFEFATQQWSEIPCPKTRISPQLVALNGKLYLAGGSSFEGGQLVPNAALEQYDPATRVWSNVLDELPIEPRHLTMLSYEGGLLLYSAHDEQGRVSLTFVQP
jgi:hypothetical protein